MLVKTISVLDARSTSLLESIEMADYLKAFKERQQSVSKALDKASANRFTALCNQRDRERSNAINAFKYFVLHCCYVQDKNIRHSGVLTLDCIQAQGWAMNESRNKRKTKQIWSLIAEIESRPDLEQAVETCACLRLKETLKEAQLAYEEATHKFNEYKVELRKINPKQERDWVIANMAGLIADLNYHIGRGIAPQAKQIMDALETYIDQVYSEIKCRATRSSNKRKKRAENPPTNTSDQSTKPKETWFLGANI